MKYFMRAVLPGLFATVMLCSWQPAAFAAVVFNIGNAEIATAGDTAVLAVSVTLTDGDTLTSYNLPIDIGDDAFGFPVGVTGFTVTNVTQLGAGVGVSGNTALPALPGIVQNYDAVFSDAIGPPPATPISDSRVLFNLNVMTDGTFVGPTPVTITNNNAPPQFNVVSSSPATFSGGIITVTAVPEPGSLAICGLVCAGVAARQRRKSKKSKLQNL